MRSTERRAIVSHPIPGPGHAKVLIYGLRLALFGWTDLNTARYTGIMIAIAVAWRIVAWMAIAARVGGIT